jgi:hypothetical protein
VTLNNYAIIYNNNNLTVSVPYIGNGPVYNSAGGVFTASIASSNYSANGNILGKYKIFYGKSTSPLNTSAQIRALSSVFENGNPAPMDAGDANHYIVAIPTTRNVQSVTASTTSFETLNYTNGGEEITLSDGGSGTIVYKIFRYSNQINSPTGFTHNLTLS